MTFTSDPNIKWIYAQRIDGDEWICKTMTGADKPANISESRMLDETPIGEMKRSEFAIFRNRPNWQTYRPFRYRDCRDHSNAPINCGGLINSLQADWF